MAERATLQAVADLAGVSLMTASRALRNQIYVKPETRRQVLAAAGKLGYRPNPLISALMADLRARRPSASTQTLAFITAFPTREHWKTLPTFHDYYRGACERAWELGYSVEHFWLREKGLTSARLSRILIARGISGVLIAPLPIPPVPVQMDWPNFAASTFGASLAEPRLHRAYNDQYHTMQIALQTAQSYGYQRLGLWVAEADDARVEHRWRAAYLSEHHRHRWPMPSPLFISPAYDDFAAFQSWFRKFRPDVVISLHLPVLDWLKRMKIKVPKDVGYVHLDLANHQRGLFAGVDQNQGLVGYAAVDLIVGQHYRNERGIPQHPKTMLVEGQWVDGPTIRIKH